MMKAVGAPRAKSLRVVFAAAAAASLAALWLAPASDAKEPVLACDPGRETCRIDLADGARLAFSLNPRPVRALETLRVEAALEGGQASAIEVRFTGNEMNMGEARVALTRAGDRFSGEAVLPVCVSGTMRWRATLFLTREGRQTALPFVFEVAAR